MKEIDFDLLTTRIIISKFSMIEIDFKVNFACNK